MANGDVVFLPAREAGDPLRYAVVQVNLALVEQDHDRRGSADDFGERGEIVDRAIGGDAGPVAAPGQLPKALFPHRCPTTTNDDRGARIPTG
jgi:hypothetical protein